MYASLDFWIFGFLYVCLHILLFNADVQLQIYTSCIILASIVQQIVN